MWLQFQLPTGAVGMPRALPSMLSLSMTQKGVSISGEDV